MQRAPRLAPRNSSCPSRSIFSYDRIPLLEERYWLVTTPVERIPLQEAQVVLIKLPSKAPENRL